MTPSHTPNWTQRYSWITSLIGLRESMSAWICSLLKSGGIAVLYGFTALLVCATARECLWEPLLARYGGDSDLAWPIFVHDYERLVEVMTAVAAAVAGRSYRPAWSIGGVFCGTAAAMLFRLAERWYRPARMPPDIWSTLLAAAFLGMLFALLGTISIPRKQVQLSASPDGGPARRSGASGVSEGPRSLG